MYICMYLHMYEFMCMCRHPYLRLYMYIRKYESMYIFIYVGIFVCYVRIYGCMYYDWIQVRIYV